MICRTCELTFACRPFVGVGNGELGESVHGVVVVDVHRAGPIARFVAAHTVGWGSRYRVVNALSGMSRKLGGCSKVRRVYAKGQGKLLESNIKRVRTVLLTLQNRKASSPVDSPFLISSHRRPCIRQSCPAMSTGVQPQLDLARTH